MMMRELVRDPVRIDERGRITVALPPMDAFLQATAVPDGTVKFAQDIEYSGTEINDIELIVHYEE